MERRNAARDLELGRTRCLYLFEQEEKEWKEVGRVGETGLAGGDEVPLASGRFRKMFVGQSLKRQQAEWNMFLTPKKGFELTSDKLKELNQIKTKLSLYFLAEGFSRADCACGSARSSEPGWDVLTLSSLSTAQQDVTQEFRNFKLYSGRMHVRAKLRIFEVY